MKAEEQLAETPLQPKAGANDDKLTMTVVEKVVSLVLQATRLTHCTIAHLLYLHYMKLQQ